MSYQVHLSHATNPDTGYRGNKRPNSLKMTALTLADASALCSQYIDDNDLGSGNWTGGQVFDGATQVARVSYNGCVWAMDDTEIQIAPGIESTVGLSLTPAPRRRP